MSDALTIDIETEVGQMRLRAKLSAFDGTTVVIGPNGAGKSTLLKSILGELRPKRGKISLGAKTLFSAEDGVEIPTEKRNLGYVPQNYALFPHMTVVNNVAFGLRSKSKKERLSKAIELLEDLRIDHLADRRTTSLSGGESQRVALARAMATGPEALLLDEPMAALDSDARRKVREFLASHLRSTGIPTIVVSHDVDDAVALGDRIAVLEQGRIVQVGTLQQLRAHPETPFVDQFVNKQEAQPAPSLAKIIALPRA